MTTATTEPWEQVDALDDGRGFVDRSSDRMLQVRGADARRWLGDLVTADVASLPTRSSRRSLLLTPTGRIRADIWIALTDDETFLVLQSNDQAESVIDLLRPYVLSSAVAVEDATGTLSATFVPARDGIVTHLTDDPGSSADHGATSVDERAYELWRVGRGDPRMGVDFDAGSLPAESGLERLIDLTKGCFLGQESVAKIRNLGHPPTVLRHVRTAGVIEADAPVHAPNGPVGRVTSAAPARRGGTVALARVAWTAAEAALSSADGEPFIPEGD
jgi:folate-binding protein YgfZ